MEDAPSKEGRENVEDDKCSGRPQTSRTAENIDKAFCGGTKELASDNSENRISSNVLSRLSKDARQGS
ncbi:hypothetical protein TNCV_4820081 [Trichonephila clavipes]|nr:hypothetical protein TNCV_4820081 [Trichonephila clavipes]